MSKGNQPRGLSPRKASIVTVRESKAQLGLEGGIADGAASANGRCWRFNLIEPTVALKNASVGMSVSGSQKDRKILVYSSIGALGLVPESKAREIMKAMTVRPSELLGRIMSMDTSRTKVEVELCLV